MTPMPEMARTRRQLTGAGFRKSPIRKEFVQDGAAANKSGRRRRRPHPVARLNQASDQEPVRSQEKPEADTDFP